MGADNMASVHMCSLILCCAPIFLTLATLSASATHATSITSNAFPALFVFGDSVLDAGNRAIECNYSSYVTLQYPYGETFPGWPFGRYSDGHTIVDFLAQSMDLPLLSPYLDRKANFEAGVNYAVAGATALDVSVLNSFHLSPETNLSLDAQLALHLAYKASVESSNGSLDGSPATTAFIEGLYIIEMGGNDYMLAYAANYSFSFVNSTLIPLVIQKIHTAVETLLDSGAKNLLLVPLSLMGCSPSLLAQFDGVMDKDGCLEKYNLASYFHGKYLHEEVANLRTLYPDASFSFMNYYGAFKHILEQKENFGFINAFDACCGAGKNYSYNVDPLNHCNINSVSICANPKVYVYWDGMHFTDSFNFQIFNQTFITRSYLDAPCSSM